MLDIGGWVQDRYDDLEDGARDIGGEISDAWHGVIDGATQEFMYANFSKYVSDWSETEFQPTGGSNGNDPVYYVNGMATNRQNAEAEAAWLANYLFRPVRLIYNGSTSWEVDLGEAFKDKIWFPPVFQHNATTRELAGLFYNAAQSGKKISLVAHSQGTIIANNAMKTLDALGYSDWVNDDLALVMTGAPLWNFEVVRPAKYKRIDNPGDGIANWLGERLDNWYGKFPISQYSDKHDFITSYVDRVSNDDLWTTVPPAPRPDRAESNDSSSTAYYLGTASPSNAVWGRRLPRTIHSTSDVDWYKFQITGGPAGSNDHIGIEFAHSQSDLDIELYRQGSNGTLSLVNSSKSSTDDEDMNISGLAVGTYYIKIYSYNNKVAAYRFSFEISPDRYSPDSYESNNTRATAHLLDTIVAGLGSSGSETNLSIHQPGDVDWFYIDSSTWAAANTWVRINFTDSNGDLDMDLYRVDGSQLTRIAVSDGESNSEQVNLNYLSAGRYYVKIYGYGDAINQYSLSYNFPGGGLPADGGESSGVGNSRAQAIDLDTYDDGLSYTYQNGLFGYSSELITTTKSIHSSTDEDWYRVTLNAWGRPGDEVDITRFLNSQGDLDLGLYNSSGTLIRSSTSTNNVEVLKFDGLAPGVYYVKVYGYNGAINYYRLATSFEPIKADRNENVGNTAATAYDLGTAGPGSPRKGFVEDLTIHPSDQDWYKFHLSAPGSSADNIAIDFTLISESIDPGDLDLELYDASLNLIRFSRGIDEVEKVSLAGLPAGDYFVKVFGYAKSTNWYAIRYDVNPKSSQVGSYQDGLWYVDVNGNRSFGAGDSVYTFGSPDAVPVAGRWGGGSEKAGVFFNGRWWLDVDGDRSLTAQEVTFTFGSPGALPVVGDWDGNGSDEIGVYLNGAWYLDTNGTGVWDAGDTAFAFGSPGALPVVGRWGGGSIDKVGVFLNGQWWLDVSGNRAWGAGDRFIVFGSAGTKPVVGNWDGVGGDEVGVFLNGAWYLDKNNSGVWEASDTFTGFGSAGTQPIVGNWSGATTRIGVFMHGTWWLDISGNLSYGAGDVLATYGAPGVLPVVGRWGGGSEKIGVFYNGVWWIDRNGDRVWSAGDVIYVFGGPGARPVVGDWDGNGTDEIGVFTNGAWALDLNGNGVFGSTDASFNLGSSSATPVVGRWGGGADKVGDLSDGGWRIAHNGDHVIGPTDSRFTFGSAGTTPVVGDWGGTGSDQVGIVLNGQWFLDLTGNGAWGTGDATFAFGPANGIPVTGAWPIASVGTAVPLLASSEERSTLRDQQEMLTQSALNQVVEQGIQLWIAAGLDVTNVDRLRRANVHIASMPGQLLGLTDRSQMSIAIDSDAAGYGWFIDPTLDDNEEFVLDAAHRLSAKTGSAASGRVDLLSVVVHELGHILGLHDLDEKSSGNQVMADTLAPGVRRLPSTESVDAVFAG